MDGRNSILVFLLACAVPTSAAAGARAAAALEPVPIRDVQIDNPFWSPKRDVWRRVTIGDCFDKFERDGAFVNFDKVRDGRGGEHGGPQRYDGLVYETITGAADFRAERPDRALERRIDGYVARIAAAVAKEVCSVARAAAPATQVATPAATIRVDATAPGRPVSRFLTGACIEDVNHEIYGGIYSQMIFGESFQEPPPSPAIKGFTQYGGSWAVRDGALHVEARDGPKLVSDRPAFADGAAGVEMRFANREGENAGLIVRVQRPRAGADAFTGYEVSLDARKQAAILGRHRDNFELIREAKCDVPVGRWVALEVRLRGPAIEILVDGRSVLRHDDGSNALAAGAVGLRGWNKQADFRNLWVKDGEHQAERLAFDPAGAPAKVSGMWRPLIRGKATGRFEVTAERPFAGAQSQQVVLESGDGEVGVENQGLNRWGMNFVAAKPYEGYVWARAEKPVTLFVAMESRDGSRRFAEQALEVAGGSNWRRMEFTLTPSAGDKTGRFVLSLKQPGAVTIGHAFLEPGEWGRFKGLPVRRDVAEGLVRQGVTVLRYGGSMVNHAGYRWKKMIGPRDRRPGYEGTWYNYSSNGWGIPDFMRFCEAAGFEYVPAFNTGETSQDMADFVEYCKSPADSEWGRKRAADGHPKPFSLRYMELGNEERVDDKYAEKFEALAAAIWAKDPKMVLVVGDFAYGRPIDDPFHFTGSASGITTLAAHRRVLRFAKEHDGEVWFDVHVDTDHPAAANASLDGMFSFTDALAKIADGARHKVVVFELNAGNHAQKRALANALAINAIERDGRIPIVTSANCLQPDRQNDNGWDQGLLFLNPSQVWLQPPGYVIQMLSANYLPRVVVCDVTAAAGARLDANAKRSEDGKTLVLQVINPGDREMNARINLAGFAPASAKAKVAELSSPLEAVNTAEAPGVVVPRYAQWPHGWKEGATRYTFPPHSFTVIQFE